MTKLDHVHYKVVYKDPKGRLWSYLKAHSTIAGWTKNYHTDKIARAMNRSYLLVFWTEEEAKAFIGTTSYPKSFQIWECRTSPPVEIKRLCGLWTSNDFMDFWTYSGTVGERGVPSGTVGVKMLKLDKLCIQ